MNDFEDMKENGNKFTKNLIKKLGAKEAAENETKVKKVGVGTGTATRSGGGAATEQEPTTYAKAVAIGVADVKARKAARQGGQTSFLSDNLGQNSILEDPVNEDSSSGRSIDSNEKAFKDQFAQQMKANILRLQKKEEAKAQQEVPRTAKVMESADNPYANKQPDVNVSNLSGTDS